MTFIPQILKLFICILPARLQRAARVIVQVGDSTKFLCKYVRWEIDTALLMNLLIMVVYLNGSMDVDNVRPPLVMRGWDILHIPFSWWRSVLRWMISRLFPGKCANTAPGYMVLPLTGV